MSGDSQKPETGRKFIKATRKTPGHAHTLIEGECGPDVTVEDIKRVFFHPMFGGRGATVGDGRFRVVRHDD